MNLSGLRQALSFPSSPGALGPLDITRLITEFKIRRKFLLEGEKAEEKGNRGVNMQYGLF